MPHPVHSHILGCDFVRCAEVEWCGQYLGGTMPGASWQRGTGGSSHAGAPPATAAAGCGSGGAPPALAAAPQTMQLARRSEQVMHRENSR
mmetsp:Transcript_130420/g.353957  ORF Transcript_130420/g.353957 Transcript_130420/m.353957 type:complete len:90 (-) Transcript_130420:220-489(-)